MEVPGIEPGAFHMQTAPINSPEATSAAKGGSVTAFATVAGSGQVNALPLSHTPTYAQNIV